ncbi:unnamed protein product [Albugo candida]|uniref:Uncharacterized protein n=1 Tax=Albugo candida TaxID=65357 RepID=A0A024FVR8_9STRA|nr:unnamed protein product [Albugo candida]|eukprot:CCI10759.1 unnamed protein product [Albugo candida]
MNIRHQLDCCLLTKCFQSINHCINYKHLIENVYLSNSRYTPNTKLCMLAYRGNARFISSLTRNDISFPRNLSATYTPIDSIRICVSSPVSDSFAFYITLKCIHFRSS